MKSAAYVSGSSQNLCVNCLQGNLLPHFLYIPKLKVRKGWYIGLDPDPTDHSNPDVKDDSDPLTRVGKVCSSDQGCF